MTPGFLGSIPGWMVTLFMSLGNTESCMSRNTGKFILDWKEVRCTDLELEREFEAGETL